MKDYYEILEVNRKASPDIIKKVFKMQVKKYHPDTVQDDQKIFFEEKVKELNEAYKILSNETKRKQYDENLNLELEEKNNNKESFEKKEAILNEQINYLKSQLQKKDQIIEHFLGGIDLSEYYEDEDIDNTKDVEDVNNQENYNNIQQENYIPYNENPKNSYEKMQNFFSPNRPYKNIYEHYLHTLLLFLTKILMLILFIAIIFAIVTNITGINMFDIFYKAFLTKH